MQVIVLLFALAAADPPKGMAYVPASQVHGRTFTSSDGWFSIDAPADDWIWLELTSETDSERRSPPETGVTWFGHGPQWKDALVIVESQSLTDSALDDTYMTAFEKKFRANLARDGQTMSKPVWEPINLPLPGSLHFKFTVTKPSGDVRYYYGYVTGRVHRVNLLDNTTQTSEPPLFRRAVVSFRWLKEP
jgi:hypothetical protein